MKRTLNEIYVSNRVDKKESRYTEADMLEAYNTGFAAGYRECYADVNSYDDDSWDE